jgi:flagellar biosynthesis GTPase FlhF
MIHRPYLQYTKYAYPVGILALLKVLFFISCSQSPVLGEKQQKEQEKIQECEEVIRKTKERAQKSDEAMQEHLFRLNATVEAARQAMHNGTASSLNQTGTMPNQSHSTDTSQQEPVSEPHADSQHGSAIFSSPQEILDYKLRNPETALTPDQSITLLNHCAELSEQNAAPTAEKTVSIFAGNTGAGKSTTLNALLGCQMKAVKPRELGLPGIKK